MDSRHAESVLAACTATETGAIVAASLPCTRPPDQANGAAQAFMIETEFSIVNGASRLKRRILLDDQAGGGPANSNGPTPVYRCLDDARTKGSHEPTGLI